MAIIVGRSIAWARAQRDGAKQDDIEIDPGAGANLTVEWFGAPGVDAQGLPGDYVAAAPGTGTGRYMGLGIVLPQQDQLAQAGEQRLFARKSDGSVAAQIWLKNTGEIAVENENGSAVWSPAGAHRLENAAGGYFELQDSGQIEMNQVTIDLSGNITTPATVDAARVVARIGEFAQSLLAGAKQLINHLHGGVTSGSSPTGPNL